jgi:hypothetical protein
VYNPGKAFETLRESYNVVEQEGSYRAFADALPFGAIGVWDDHDLGVNDGGGDTERVEERKQLFLDFLRLPASAPQREPGRGLYSSHVYPGKSGFIQSQSSTLYIVLMISTIVGTFKSYHRTSSTTYLFFFKFL